MQIAVRVGQKRPARVHDETAPPTRRHIALARLAPPPLALALATWKAFVNPRLYAARQTRLSHRRNTCATAHTDPKQIPHRSHISFVTRHAALIDGACAHQPLARSCGLASPLFLPCLCFSEESSSRIARHVFLPASMPSLSCSYRAPASVLGRTVPTPAPTLLYPATHTMLRPPLTCDC